MLREAGMSGQIVSARKAVVQVKQGQEGGERGEKHCIAWKSSQILCSAHCNATANIAATVCVATLVTFV